ncbi:MAG: amidohydrolase family protein [Desulfatibacillaceae bacterium]
MNEFMIRAGTLYDGLGGEPLKNARVLVRGERIARIESGERSGLDRGRPVLDARGGVVIPGLVDAHRHVFNCGGFEVGVGVTPLQIARNLSTTVREGVTSILDVGGPSFLDMVARAVPRKPRVFRVGSFIAPAGGYPGEWMGRLEFSLGVAVEARDKKQVRKIVRRMHKKGVAAIKTSVVTRAFDGRPLPTWKGPVLRALCDEAHSLGLKVGAHVAYPEDYGTAVRCGIDVIHHASAEPMHEEDLHAMAEAGCILVPTLSLFDVMARGVTERWVDRPDWRPPVNRALMRSMQRFTEAYERTAYDDPVPGFYINGPKRMLLRAPKMASENTRRFIAAGGKVALGTDMGLGFLTHGCPARELEMMAECGLSLPGLIRAATGNAAAVFGMDHELGAIRPGMLADITVLAGDPRKDAAALCSARSVIAGGKVVHGDGPTPPRG